MVKKTDLDDLEETDISEQLDEIQGRMGQLKSSLDRIKKDFSSFSARMKRDKRNYLLVVIVGVAFLLMGFTGLFIDELQLRGLTFNTNHWNAFITFGSIITGLGFLLFQLSESKRDFLKLYVIQKQLDEAIHMANRISQLDQAYSMALAVYVSENIDPAQLKKYSLLGASALKHDSIHPDAFIAFLEDHLDKAGRDEKKRMEIAIKGFKAMKELRKKLGVDKEKAKKIAEELRKSL